MPIHLIQAGFLSDTWGPPHPYLSYLRDVSRRLAGRTGFDRLLLHRQALPFVRQIRHLDTYIHPANPDYDYFDAVFRKLEREPAQRLYLGFGLVAGKANGRQPAGPLLYLPVSMTRQERTGFIQLEPEPADVCLNHDLLAALPGVGEAFDEAELDFWAQAEEALVSRFDEQPLNLERLALLAEYYWQGALHPDLTENSFIYEFLSGYAAWLMSEASDALPRLAEISTHDGAYNYEDEIAIRAQVKGPLRALTIFDGPPAFVNACHFFVAEEPHELSAHRALTQLAAQPPETFANPMTRLLYNRLANDDAPLPPFEAAEAPEIPPLPISLNPNQAQALKLAWSSPLTYIQGPPGTGKSHFIVALMLSALRMGKTVLFVAQQEPALRVVEEQLAGWFDADASPLMRYRHDTRTDLRASLKRLLQQQPESETPAPLEAMINRAEATQTLLRDRLDNAGNANDRFASANESLISAYQAFRDTYAHLETPPRQFGDMPDPERCFAALATIRRINGNAERRAQWHAQKFKAQLMTQFKAQRALLEAYFEPYAEDLLRLNAHAVEVQTLLDAGEPHYHLHRLEYDALTLELIQLRTQQLRMDWRRHIGSALTNPSIRPAVEGLEKLLYWRKPALAAERMARLDYGAILSAFPLWAAQIRHLGQIFPSTEGLFDLVVVDEASQVNLAEVLPAFYRGKHVCVVGDHRQLSLVATGVNFQLGKKFDQLSWNRHKPGGLSYEDAADRRLTASDASILDFMAHFRQQAKIPQVLLNEHFRSAPALARYTARFYAEDEPLLILTDRPDRALLPSFRALHVEGRRGADKTVLAEAEKVVELLTDLMQAGPWTEDVYPTARDGFTIGVVSFIREQCRLIGELAEAAFPPEQWARHRLFIGTPEEFQGHERDVILLSLCLDAESRASAAHYQRPERLNVATSRARHLTVVVHAGLPPYMTELKTYLNFFQAERPVVAHTMRHEFTTELEAHLYSLLQKFVVEASLSEAVILPHPVVCGQHLPGFLIETRGAQAALLVIEGLPKLRPEWRRSVFERALGVWRRAGWPVVTTPYAAWYADGNLRAHEGEVRRIFYNLRQSL